MKAVGSDWWLMNSSPLREFMAAGRKWWLTPVPTPIFAMSLSGSSLVAFKVAAILAFVYLTNQHLDLGERVGVLIRNFDGYHGVLVFGGLWAVCLAGMLAAGFLPGLWLRVVFALPLLAGALVGSAYEDVAGSEIDYDQVLVLRESVSHLGSAVRLHVPSVLIDVVFTLLGAAGLLLPLKPARSVVAVAPIAETASDGGVGGAGRGMGTTDSPGLRHRLRALLPAGVAGLSLGRRHRILLPVAVAVLPFVVLPAVIVARGGYGMGGLPIQHKAPSLFLVAEVAGRLTGVERRPVDLALAGEAAGAPHVVLVIDDGVRGDYLDLNVERGTTPTLLRHRDRIANFGHAVSAANCSPASNLVLRTGAMPADVQGGAQTNPYVWSYARRAGMRTVFLHPPWGLAERARRLSAAELEHIDELVVQKGDVPVAHDLDAVDVLGELLARADRQFIILMKSGIHFPYEIVFPEVGMRFPRMTGRERPVAAAGPAPGASYEDAVTWQVDRFFEQLFSTVALDDAVLLYTSSHGQSLPDEGGERPACSAGNPSSLEGLVPMLAVTYRPDWLRRFEQAAAHNLNRTSHFNLLATLLALFGYDREQVAARFEPSLLDPIKAEYSFTTGLVTRSPRLVVGPRTELPMYGIPREVLDRGGRR